MKSHSDIITVLLDDNYTLWNTQEEDMAGKGVDYAYIKHSFQKRIDQDNPKSEVCQTNDKLLINVDYWEMYTSTIGWQNSVEIYLKHESVFNDWCDLGMYGIPVDKFMKNKKAYEDRVIGMWDLANSSLHGVIEDV